MKRYNSSFSLFWFVLINIIYMLPLVFFFFKLFSFFLASFLLAISLLLETPCFSLFYCTFMFIYIQMPFWF